MSGLAIFLLVAQGVLFVIWAVLMFRALFGIRRRYQAETGHVWIGPIAVFGVYGAYLKDVRFRRERRFIVLVLALFIVVSYAFYLIQTPQG